MGSKSFSLIPKGGYGKPARWHNITIFKESAIFKLYKVMTKEECDQRIAYRKTKTQEEFTALEIDLFLKYGFISEQVADTLRRTTRCKK